MIERLAIIHKHSHIPHCKICKGETSKRRSSVIMLVVSNVSALQISKIG